MAILKDLIIQSKEEWKNEYDYSLIEKEFDINMKVNKKKDMFPIICKKHGVFYRTFTDHLGKRHRGCQKCSKEKGRKWDTETIINALQNLKQFKNCTFENTVYNGYRKKIHITCHEIDPETGVEHGDFEISIGHAISGEGCPKCRYIKSAASLRRSLDEVINEAKKVHGNKYDYSLITEYKNDRINYPMVCHKIDTVTGEEHGVFYRNFNNLIHGKQGCPKCGIIKCSESRKMKFDDYIDMAKNVHNGKYSYINENWTGESGKITYICPIHGKQTQDASNHLYLGHGCPKCGARESASEREVANFIIDLLPTEKVLTRQKGLLLNAKEELDVYVPSKNFAVEYDGLFWHSEKYRANDYHLNKTKSCNNRGIRLFHIFEDEWIYKQDIIKSMLRNILGKTEISLMARKCVIKEVDSKTSKVFLNENHLQGYCNSKIRIGLFHEDELVSLMTFGKSRHFIGNSEYEWELLRFANKINTSVAGGASRLLNYFIKTYLPKSIVSYADRRWSTGSLYEKLGFTKYNESKPNYYYIINRKRVYRFNLRKQVLISKYNCPPEVTEKEFCRKNGWLRIYDCGCQCYKLTFNND